MMLCESCHISRVQFANIRKILTTGFAGADPDLLHRPSLLCRRACQVQGLGFC